MPEVVACPECGRKLRVPDEFLGKKVKCPQCSAMFKAEVGGSTGDADAGGANKRGGGGNGGENREERGSLIDRAMARTGGGRPRKDEDDEEDRPRSRRSRDEDDEDDDRESRRRSRDDDEDDRPRSRRSRDEDDDDRPSRRRGRRDDYEDDDDEDRGRGGNPKQQKAGWKSVSFGLFLIIISVWIYIGYLVISFLGNFVLFQFLSSGNVSTLITLSYGLSVINLLLTLAYLGSNMAGHGFILATPDRPGWATRTLGITSFSCLAFGTVCFLMAMLWGIVTMGLVAADPFAARGMASAAPLMVGLMLIGGLSYVGGSIVFMFYLNNVCLRIQQHALAKQVIVCFVSIVGAIVIGFLLTCLVGAIMGGIMAGSRNVNELGSGAAVTGYVGMVFGCILGLVGLGLFVWYVVLLYQVRSALDQYIRRKL